MTKFLNDFLKSDKTSVTVRSFNVVQMVFIIGLSLMTGVIYYCIDNPFYTYLTIVFVMLFLVNLFDANKTGNQKRCAIIMSILFNLVYLPICFFGFNRLICVVPMYFVVGLLYTGLLVDGKLGIVLSFIETAFMAIIIFFFGADIQLSVPGQESFVDIIAVVVAVFIVGILSAVSVKFRVIQYNNEHNKVEDVHEKVINAYNQKDIFLANTSHEIRTPLNAIVGTVNMLLDSDLDSYSRENIYNILNSCNALLSITDELMDLSNTENKSLDIVDYKYDFSEMLVDIINMMSVRLMESDITFWVDIDKGVPKYLIGDNVKVRQLFINILNNAVKYTKQGKIILRVKSITSQNGDVQIYVEVEDTGIGIKEENIPKLFDFYKRDDDSTETRTIEGTGIGLNLCKEIIDKMNGHISVKSEYHVGSTFFFDFKQHLETKERIVELENEGQYNVLIFERNEELSLKVRDILNSLSVKSEVASSRMEFESFILSDRFNYIFISYEKYMENKRFIDRKIKNERLVIISDITQSVSVTQNAYLLTRPIYSLNCAMSLLNKTSNHVHEVVRKGGFIAPESNILVVDDNLTNLEVARGLLNKYECKTVTALSGAECLNILNTSKFDIIFLDYMMPEMNGIDTLIKIREIEDEDMKAVPIIALTANVVNGAREMFLDAGFSDYIAKPINISKLENVLKEFLPKEKIQLRNNNGID